MGKLINFQLNVFFLRLSLKTKKVVATILYRNQPLLITNSNDNDNIDPTDVEIFEIDYKFDNLRQYDLVLALIKNILEYLV